jgi:hypothetical protein
MPFRISRVDVWAGELEERPGGLNEKLEVLAKAGANLEFVISRRVPDKPGTGVVFLAPVRGAAQMRAAKNVGLSKATGLCSLRVESVDRLGLGAKITRAVAEAGISLRGLSAGAVGRRSVTYLAFDTDADARKASRALKTAPAGK